MSSVKDHKSFTAEDLFDNMTLDDGSKDAKTRTAPGRPANRPPGGPPRGENNPPRGRGAPPSSSHRPTRSQEEALKARRMHSASNGGEKGLSGSPHRKQADRRPRRNSDSSMIEKPLTEEEKKARELRRKERERRHREGKDKDKPKTARKIDIIDQLDATSIYGTGLFHHDGPFDACNPHRNRKGSRRAPMQAFAKDSANNSIGGSGPLNKRPDHMQFMGQEPHDVSNMYGNVVKERSSGSKSEATLFDPKQASEFVVGEETLGLGSSTFLEGTPAARAAIQRNQAETAQEVLEQGLGRKKSVVQRFRSIKRAPREPREFNPDGDRYTPRTGDMPSGSSTGERNPFFAEFDGKAEERISVKHKDSNQVPPVTPPVPSLERRGTNDGAESPDGARQANGFMSRVKSLKGGRRPRPEVPSRDVPPAPGVAM
ncbi:Pal1-domain-containing protein [Daldinia decipiens]|uniref:Pal1-domain-containing protein n=1 Tax=Daldinia decipiens TaxID=326647 RepID=UPI0020C2FF90|nr:Pal1-domain-containing protein [Daldinia decipiens]KAI1658780.1 Pal1-domain-containing protein [Daldinia decipiens]